MTIFAVTASILALPLYAAAVALPVLRWAYRKLEAQQRRHSTELRLQAREHRRRYGFVMQRCPCGRERHPVTGEWCDPDPGARPHEVVTAHCPTCINRERRAS